MEHHPGPGEAGEPRVFAPLKYATSFSIAKGERRTLRPGSVLMRA
jgi:hypothetical protein